MGPDVSRRLSMARIWSMSRSESRASFSRALTLMRSGSASSMRFVVRGMMIVEGWPASKRAWSCRMRTGRIFPGSVPVCGLRFASQIVPCLIAGVMFDLAEFRIDPHAFLAYSPAKLHDPGPSPIFFDFAVHRQDGLAQVRGARHIQILRDP